ncbi:MAG: hypothetical protein ACYDB6_09640 [Candidatus Limnocylindrales bacterium]
MTHWLLKDDSDYLAWLVSHDDGFVLNTAIVKYKGLTLGSRTMGA